MPALLLPAGAIRGPALPPPRAGLFMTKYMLMISAPCTNLAKSGQIDPSDRLGCQM